MTLQVFHDLYEPCPKYSCFTSLVSALFNATACSAFTFFLCRTSSMSSISFGSIPSLSRNSSFSISVSFTLISNLLTWLVKSTMFLRCGNKNQTRYWFMFKLVLKFCSKLILFAKVIRHLNTKPVKLHVIVSHNLTSPQSPALREKSLFNVLYLTVGIHPLKDFRNIDRISLPPLAKHYDKKCKWQCSLLISNANLCLAILDFLHCFTQTILSLKWVAPVLDMSFHGLQMHIRVRPFNGVGYLKHLPWQKRHSC